MGSFSRAILLVLIYTCDLSLDCPREECKLHFFSHLLRDPVKSYPPALSFRTLVMVEKEA
jgi:hypothetical protein